jgi:hypothetical protein
VSQPGFRLSRRILARMLFRILEAEPWFALTPAGSLVPLAAPAPGHLTRETLALPGFCEFVQSVRKRGEVLWGVLIEKRVSLDSGIY